MEIIELTKEDLNENLFKDIVFFMHASSGAMGEPGAFWSVHKSGKVYHVNLLDKNMEIRDITKYITKRKPDKPFEFTAFSLGCGNKLAVHDDVYKQFKKRTKVRRGNDCSLLYPNWKEVVLDIVSKTYPDLCVYNSP